VGTQIPNRDSHYQTRDGLLFVFLPEDYRKEVLREDQVFELMSRIPARDKLLIADVPHFAFETGRSRSLGFRFIGGCRRNELTFTKDIDGKQRGVFTYHLIRHIDQEDDRRLTYGDLLGRVTASLNAAGFSHTHPVHVGARKTPVFPRHEPDYLWLYELSCGRDCAALTDGEMAMWRQMLEDSPITTSPEANMALARALAARGAFDPALEAVRRASSGGLEKVAEPLLLQLRTLIRARRYHEAATFVERLGARASDPCLASLPQATHGLLAILDRGEKHALLVGIGSYASADLLRAKDAPDDVAGLRDELVTRWGFQPGNIVVLTDAQASREAILDELRRLAELARDKPTLFYFSGLGSVDADGEPVLLGADARQAEIQDIPISMLHEIAAPIRRNLVTLIDAGFSVESKDPRFVDPAPGSGFLYWGHGGQIARRMSDHHGIGGLSVFPASMRYIRRGQERSQSGKAHGSTSKRATRLFLDALRAGEMPTVSRAELRARLVASGLTVLGAASDEPLFANLNVVARVEAALDGIEGRPLMVARDLLTKLLQCRGGADPRLLLELGVALHVLTLRDSARRALEDAARMLHSKDAVSNRDMRARADAHYYLGYVLLAEGQYSNAVSHFELVLAESPGHAKAHYYRGLALQKLIELDLFRQIEESWKTYLKLGAPIGHAREVTDFLDRRQAQTSDS
jgi:tetratricopeptide (TPR) repeat protein